MLSHYTHVSFYSFFVVTELQPQLWDSKIPPLMTKTFYKLLLLSHWLPTPFLSHCWNRSLLWPKHKLQINLLLFSVTTCLTYQASSCHPDKNVLSYFQLLSVRRPNHKGGINTNFLKLFRTCICLRYGQQLFHMQHNLILISITAVNS